MKHPNIRSWLVAVVALYLISCESETVRTELSEMQVSAITDLMGSARVPGLQIGYFTGNEESLFVSGFTNLKDSSKVTENTLFQANDLGYSVIAAICFRLAEENQLDLDQAVTIDYQDTRLISGTYNHLITYNHLLSHTGGLPVWADINEDIEVIHVPGEKWNYSHLGFEWITKALEAKFNTSIQQLATKWVFEPLGMNHSFFGEKKPGDYASSHDLIGRLRAPDMINTTTYYTHAGDHLKLLKAFSSDFFQTVSRKNQLQTLAEVNLWEDETEPILVSWGPGLGIQSGNEGQALWQYSDEQTMKSFAIVYPNSKEGWVVLTNSENGFAISKSLARLFFRHDLAALNWLGYESYNNAAWQTRRDLESAFAFDDGETAMAQYHQILSERPDELNDALINNVIWSFFEKNELHAAEKLARLHLESFPDLSNTYIRLGEALGFQSKYEESWASYQRAMELDPEASEQIMPRFPWYMEATQAMQETQELPLGLFTGTFGNSTVVFENDLLTYSDELYQNVPLKRIGNTLFDLEAAATFRINFLIENGQVVKLEKSHLNGERSEALKTSI